MMHTVHIHSWRKEEEEGSICHDKQIDRQIPPLFVSPAPVAHIYALQEAKKKKRRCSHAIMSIQKNQEQGEEMLG